MSISFRTISLPFEAIRGEYLSRTQWLRKGRPSCPFCTRYKLTPWPKTYDRYIQCKLQFTTTTTTAQITMHAFSICGTALGKRPPPLPSHSASYNITANHHRHHLDHHSTSYNACIQYMRHCFRKKNRPPVQVTVGLVQHQHPSDHRMCQGVPAHSGGK